MASSTLAGQRGRSVLDPVKYVFVARTHVHPCIGHPVGGGVPDGDTVTLPHNQIENVHLGVKDPRGNA